LRNIGEKSELRLSLEELQSVIEKSPERWTSTVEALASIGSENAKQVILEILEDHVGFLEEDIDFNLLFTVSQIAAAINLTSAIKFLREIIFSSQANEQTADALASLNDCYILSRLTRLWVFSKGTQFYWAIISLQKSCKFYNYELTQTTPSPKLLEPSPIGSPSQINNYYDLRGANIGNWAENQYGTQQTTQIRSPSPPQPPENI
jgi:hypothetical protein